MRAEANGYTTQTVGDIVVTDENAAIVDFELEHDVDAGGICAYRIVFVGSGSGNPSEVLGKADGKSFSGNFAVDMQYPIENIDGNDIVVHTDGQGNYACSASEEIDGPWESLGTGNGTTEFDLSGISPGRARYVRVEMRESVRVQRLVAAR